MNRDITDPPAIVWTAQQLSEAFQEVKALEFSAETNGREMLRNYRDMGKKLIEIRKASPPRQWLKILEQHMPGRQRLAYKCVAIADNWEIVRKAANMSEALEIIDQHDGAELEAEDAKVATQQFSSSTQPQTGKDMGKTSDNGSAGRMGSSGGRSRGKSSLRCEDLDEKKEEEEKAGKEEEPEREPDTEEGPDVRTPLKHLKAAMNHLTKVRQHLSLAIRDEHGRKALKTTSAGQKPGLKLLVIGGSIAAPGANGEEIKVPKLSNAAIDDLMWMVAQAQQALKDEEDD